MNERRGDKGVHAKQKVDDLTQEQAMTLHHHENFGWSAFVRRPLFQEPQPVVVSPDRSVVGLVDADGEVLTEHDIKLRD